MKIVVIERRMGHSITLHTIYTSKTVSMCLRTSRVCRALARLVCFSWRMIVEISALSLHVSVVYSGGGVPPSSTFVGKARLVRFTSETGRAASLKQTKEQKSKAGKVGFERTMELHPFFARNWLKKKIKGSYPGGRVVSELNTY